MNDVSKANMTKMNKNLSTLLTMVTVLTVQTTAQIGPVIRTNVTDPLVGRYSLGTEVVLSDQFSLGLDVDFISRNTPVTFYEGGRPGEEPQFGGGLTQKRGVILEPQMRWYPGKAAGLGMYAAISGFLGYARYIPVDWFWGYDRMEWRGRGSSFQLGHQRRVKRLLLDTYIGVTWTRDQDKGFYEDLALFPQPTGFRMSAGLRLGFNAGGSFHAAGR